MIRLFELVASALGLVLLLPLFLVLGVLVALDMKAPPLFIQKRVGRGQRPFYLVKWRTMRPDAPSVATHLVSTSHITPLGGFLRRSKLDELPQLWNVLVGEMSLVGPRPCLVTQTELIEERAKRGVFEVRPGITGKAQIAGVDMSQPQKLAEIDAEMIREWSVANYFRYVVRTVLGSGAGDRVRA